MRAYIAFINKEFCEYLRTYKLFILIAVFLLFGFMNPIVAKVMPELLTTLMPEGMSFNLGTPTALDSWAQFFKNVSQTGTFVLVIIMSGIIANEFNRGTLINMLTKGLPRPTVILSKFTSATAIWTLSYVLCFAVTYAYTAYFWNMDGIVNMFLSVFCLWLFGVLLIALLVFGGVLFSNIYGSLLLTGGAVVFMTVLNIAPAVRKYNPITLSSENMALITAQKASSEFLPAIIICTIAIIALTTASIGLFNKKQV
jgi:ABC-2 type transport system permease protein